MNALQLFVPCAAGVESFLAYEVAHITGLASRDTQTLRGGVQLQASWRAALQLNLHSRLGMRVLIQLAHQPYASEDDIYNAASAVAWEMWFTHKQSFRVEITAQHSPLKSLNFATLRVKDAIADRFRDKSGQRPDVDTQRPDVRVHAHLTEKMLTLYLDTTGEPLFKRGWREDTGDAPLKETLAAAMLAASGWSMPLLTAPGETPPVVPSVAGVEQGLPLYDPCCGSGTIVIEAAQIACRMAAGLQRRFGFEKLRVFDAHVWQQLQDEARALQCGPRAPVFGSDVTFRMVDFAQRNAERAGVAKAVNLRGGDALQRMPPTEELGVMLVNPPYGERIEAAGVAGAASLARSGREVGQVEDGGEFFSQLASHWKKNYTGWRAWVLTPDLKLPGRMRLKESRRVPMWNGPIECRMFRFDLMAGSARKPTA
ncbi:MAG: class I SAM-dependent RNA methyltransferase [Burkholderiales bacterium]|nr:class I SAM-dependent RNA methyltransferase [Burkholderiales bacterium]